MALINLKIDVTKIDKERLFKSEKGSVYLDITAFINPEADQYGQFGMIVQDVTKEEREAGVKGPILGNVRRMNGISVTDAKAPAAPSAKQASAPIGPKDDLPF